MNKKNKIEIVFDILLLLLVLLIVASMFAWS